MAKKIETKEADAVSGNREQVSVFLPPALKAKLEDAARANFRTASSEAAFRIAKSLKEI